MRFEIGLKLFATWVLIIISHLSSVLCSVISGFCLSSLYVYSASCYCVSFDCVRKLWKFLIMIVTNKKNFPPLPWKMQRPRTKTNSKYAMHILHTQTHNQFTVYSTCTTPFLSLFPPSSHNSHNSHKENLYIPYCTVVYSVSSNRFHFIHCQ